MKAVLLLGVVFLAIPSDALAYIDPGTSSIAYQVIVAGALAFGFGVRRALRGGTRALGRWFRHLASGGRNTDVT